MPSELPGLSEPYTARYRAERCTGSEAGQMQVKSLVLIVRLCLSGSTGTGIAFESLTEQDTCMHAGPQSLPVELTQDRCHTSQSELP